MRRGIWETTGLYAEATEAGWLAVTCESRTMAAWLCAAIILENVDAWKPKPSWAPSGTSSTVSQHAIVGGR